MRSKAALIPPESTTPLDVALAGLAMRQHGVVAGRQLRALGLSDRAERDRVAAGRLHRVHRGVYAVGHARLSPDGYALAAVLAAGPGAVLSHRSAATLWGIRPSARQRHEVTVTTRRRVRGVEVHQTRHLPPADVTTLRGIPVTTVPRTLVDLADHLPLDALAKALHEAEMQRLYDRRAIAEAIGRANGRRGVSRLGAALGEPDPGVTRSDLEWALTRLCRDFDIPLPELNAPSDLPTETVEVDALWRDALLVAELDGGATHHTRRAFHNDRRRDSALAALGFLAVRYTYPRLSEEREQTANELKEIRAVRCSAVWTASPSTSA